MAAVSVTLDSAQSGRNREAPAAVAGDTEPYAWKQAARPGPPSRKARQAGCPGEGRPAAQGLKLVCADSLAMSGESQSIHFLKK